MKALVYEGAHSLEDSAIKLVEIPEPSLREFDVLVDVHAVGVNPGETFIRRTRIAEPGGHVLFGWEFAGGIVETGSGARGVKTGDRVFGTGDVSRDRIPPEFYRIVCRSSTSEEGYEHCLHLSNIETAQHTISSRRSDSEGP